MMRKDAGRAEGIAARRASRIRRSSPRFPRRPTIERATPGQSNARSRPVALLALIALAAISLSSPARAFEALDGRFQAHGFFESQMRSISEDYSGEWDIVQWYNIFNLEIELDILPEGFGFVDMMSGFVRLEARYDCVYSRGCGMMRNVNVYGDRAESLPRRLASAREYKEVAGAFLLDGETERLADGTRDPVPLSEVNGFSTAAEQKGADRTRGRIKEDWRKDTFVQGVGQVTIPTDSRFDDPFVYLFESFEDFRFAQIEQIGGSNSGRPVAVLGPWLPKNFVVANAGLADRVNPFDNSRQSPVVAAAAYNSAYKSEFVQNANNRLTRGRPGRANQVSRRTFGSGALPYRAIGPSNEGKFGIKNGRSRGIYLPSQPARDLTLAGKVDDFTRSLNFRESERAWNRGASQQDEKELKEAYLDIELFDSRLWLRLGRQTIVWGKTELFRTTDQFNPQDLALASLPSLEESRIALWSARAVYSFYEVGPFSDVRLELAMNYDQYESADLGACGEAYTVNLVCQGAFGAFAHSTTGIGLLGARVPDDPWEDRKGIEFGARLEWRWDRFSFSVTNFYGYDDLPWVERVSTFERNVDPETGRPRIMGARSACRKGIEDDCLTPGPTRSRTVSSKPLQPNNPDTQVKNPDFRDNLDPFQNRPRVAFKDNNNALHNHPGNIQLFAMICATTIGVVDLDGSACAQNVFGSTKLAIPGVPGIDFTVGQASASILAGQSAAASLLQNRIKFNLVPYLQPLNKDVGDLRNPKTTVTIRVNNVDASTGDVVEAQDGLPNNRIRYRAECLDSNVSTFPNIPCGGVAEGTSGFGILVAAGEALAQHVSPEQEAILGCGSFFGTNCDNSGIDLMNADATALLQSFPGFEGTRIGWSTNNQLLIQPGTVGFEGGPVCQANYLFLDSDKRRNRKEIRLPGCRNQYELDGITPNREHRARKDGCVRYDPDIRGCDDPDLRTLYQPVLANGQAPGPCFNPDGSREVDPRCFQVFANELAALSFNFLMLTTANDIDFKKNLRNRRKKEREENPGIGNNDPRFIFAQIEEAFTNGQCSLSTPQYCENVQGLLRLAGLTRADVRASGNGNFGRRAFQWHGGGELMIRFNKRNVLGFSTDFAEDTTKSNWSMEFTWIPDNPRGNSESYDGNIEVDQFNLTISADRPTFINFLNANRTFFFNTQWFIQYLDGFRRGSGNGPWNVLFTFAVTTGYWQDRLLPSVATVYDFNSVSGAVLPQVTYRYNDAFSVTVGANIFMGQAEFGDMSVNPVGLNNRVQGDQTYKNEQQNGLSVLRDRDEIFVRLRYTF